MKYVIVEDFSGQAVPFIFPFSQTEAFCATEATTSFR